MNKEEMTQVFKVMLLAWPSADMFRGGMQKLEPTIKLWTSCLADIDFWTAQQATYQLCKSSKFPPTIAEFRTESEAFERNLKIKADEAYLQLKGGAGMMGPEKYYERLPGGPMKSAIDALGGIDAVYDDKCWHMKEIKEAYIRAQRASLMTSEDCKQLAEGTK